MNPFSALPMNLARRWKVSIGAEIITCNEAIDNIPAPFMGDEEKRHLKKIILDTGTTAAVLAGYSDSVRPFAPDLADCINSILASRANVAVDPIQTPPVSGSGGASSSSSAVPIVLGVVGGGALLYYLSKRR